MSGMMTGAILGLVLGIAGFAAMRKLAQRVKLPETKTALNLAAIVDLVLFPVLGAFAGGLITGD
jgi:NhaP-type Na+/H+ or K+/H+ antiporter